MLAIKKILLPVDFPNTALPVIHQAATLGRHFHSEILMLHAVTASSRAAGVPRGGHAPNGWDLLAEIIKGAEKQREHTLAQDLVGLTIQRSLVNGDAAEAIMEAATQQNADLIMMPSHGSSFDQFLMGSVTTKVLSETNCPVWTGAHLKESHSKKFALRSILCAVDFRPA